MPTRKEAERSRHIAEFWARWAGNRDYVAQAIETGTSRSLVDTVTRQVRTVHPSLAWELMPGTATRHVLVITGERDPDATWFARQLLAAGPAPDRTWGYAAARPPRALDRIVLRASPIDLRATSAQASLDRSTERLDLRVFNTAFVAMPPELRAHAARVFVDWLLGEEDAARWIGTVQPVDAELDLDPPALLEEVDVLRAQATGRSWSVSGRRASDGGPLLVYINGAVKRVDHIEDRWHAVIDVHEVASDLSATPAHEPEESLTAAGATLVAVTKDRHRRRYHFVAPQGGAFRIAARAWVAESGLRATIEMDLDPQWSFIDSLDRVPLDPVVREGRGSTAGPTGLH